MPSENVIHIKLDYMEALKAKRNILSSELGSLKVEKRIERYRMARMEELMLKFKAYGKIKELKSNIRKLQGFLPNPKIPKIIKKEEALREKFERRRGAEEEAEVEKKEAYGEKDIESQLGEIQRRLARLQRENI
ncbi:MAG: hypothetical protein AABX79_00440 [Nanoarchaeota archaeon]